MRHAGFRRKTRSVLSHKRPSGLSYLMINYQPEDRVIINNRYTIDTHTGILNNYKYENESYERLRYELSEFLQKETSLKEKGDINNIINKQNNEINILNNNHNNNKKDNN